GQWNTDGRTGGVYFGAGDNITVEDCVFYHCGWKIGASRDDTPTNGGTTIFSHTFYIQLDTNNCIIRRNLIMDGAADGGSLRGDNALYTQNVMIRCPISMGLGGGHDYYLYRPSGVTFEGSYNLALAGNDLNSSNPRGTAFEVSNGKPGSKVHHNLAIRGGGTDAYALINNADFDQPSYCDFEDNVSVNWNVSGQSWSDNAFFPAQVHSTRSRNKWDDP